MTFDGRLATTLVMLALFAGACLLSLDLPQKAAFMPLLVGIPGTILCLWQLILDLRRPAEAPKPAAPVSEGEGTSELQVFLWLGAFAAAIFGFGFIIGGPLVVMAFIRFSSGESWRNAIFAAAGTFLVIWGVFIWLLELPLFQGLVLEAFL
jgi:hypothetical protein